MRQGTILLALLSFLAFSPPALAGKNEGGALIVHTDDEVGYTANVCDIFPDPGSCENANTRTDKDETTTVLIWIVAAFHPDSEPGVAVITFGLDHNLPSLDYFVSWHFCPIGAGIEIPDAAWPLAGGTSVGYFVPVVGDHLFMFYYFEIYGFPGAYIGTGIHEGFDYASFVDDSYLPVDDRIDRFGMVRWYEDGSNTCPVAPPMGACCLPDDSCVIAFDYECASQNGDFQGDGVPCAPDPCAPVAARASTWGRIKADYR